MSASELRRLRDRVEQLERVLGIDQSMTMRLRAALKITPDQAKILGMMLRRSRVSRDGIFDVLYGDKPECDWPDDKVLDVQLSSLRKALKDKGIAFETFVGDGWSLEPAQKLKLRKLLDAHEQAHAEASPLPTPRWQDFQLWNGRASAM